jgi:hypothetical protein
MAMKKAAARADMIRIGVLRFDSMISFRLLECIMIKL